jgi:hypothetical protein
MEKDGDKDVRITGNVNGIPGTFSLDALDVKITAFVSQDGNEISFVMFTPTMPDRSGGFDAGTIKINMPAGFEIGSVKAVRSTGQAANELMQPDDVTVSEDRKAAWVTLPRSNILSVKFTKR